MEEEGLEMPKWSKGALAVACVSIACLALTGCQMAAQETAQTIVNTAMGGKVNANGNKITVKGQNGGQVTFGGSQTLPADFPKDVPIYPNARIIASASANAGGKPAWEVTYLAPDAPQAVISWYAAQMKSNGWKSTAALGEGQGSVMNAQKANSALSVAVMPSTHLPYKSSVTLSVRNP